MTVQSGPEGADFRFYLEPDHWGLSGVTGNPFYVREAELEGPGNLKVVGALIADPSPTSCFRGGFQGYRPDYRLQMPADSETVVNVPVKATSSRLAGMKSGISLTIPKLDGYEQYRTEIPIGGPEGVRVSFRVQGQGENPAPLKAGSPFRLAGATFPALANTKIKLIAEPRMHRFGAPYPTSHRLTTVSTDGSGRFRSAPVRLNGDRVWVLKATPTTGPAFDDTPSCGPVVETKAASRPADTSDLGNHRFRSVSVKGTKLVGQKKVSLAFKVRLVDHDDDPTTVLRQVRTLSGNAGCNRMAGGYWLKDGRLRWAKPLASTKKRCRKPVDRWLAGNLQRGVTARMVEGRLVLSNKQGLKIVLRRVR